MAKQFGELFKAEADEGREKHVPVIECPKKVSKGELFKVSVVVGKEVPHPNQLEHHIRSIDVYAVGKNGLPVHAAGFEFGPTYAEPEVEVGLRLDETSSLYAVVYCNIHGIWESSADVDVE